MVQIHQHLMVNRRQSRVDHEYCQDPNCQQLTINISTTNILNINLNVEEKKVLGKFSVIISRVQVAKESYTEMTDF